eukprot:9597729-Lingulodinium_polyedra.AAC.1
MEVSALSDETAPDAGANRGARGLEPASTLVPPCPGVALYGKLLSDSVLCAWWDRWAGKQGPASPVAIELRKICKGDGPANPSEPLCEWL